MAGLAQWVRVGDAWHLLGREPDAIVRYSEEPSPETGHVGWCWWALGKMGDAPTREAACAAAEAEIRRAILRALRW